MCCVCVRVCGVCDVWSVFMHIVSVCVRVCVCVWVCVHVCVFCVNLCPGAA